MRDFAEQTNLHIDRAFSSINEKIDSNAIRAVDAELVQYTFRMLYNSVDIKTAVCQLFEIIGRAYDVSRVYIFENTKDGKHCSNTFEWCSDGVPSEMGNLQNLSYENELNGYMDCFDSAGIFLLPGHPPAGSRTLCHIGAPGIVSLLQCAIMDDGVFKGFVGFDECRRNRNWNKDQIDSLILVANVLTTFLLKRKAERRTCPCERDVSRTPK